MGISSGHIPFPDYPRDPFVTHISFMGLRVKPIESTPLEY